MQRYCLAVRTARVKSFGDIMGWDVAKNAAAGVLDPSSGSAGLAAKERSAEGTDHYPDRVQYQHGSYGLPDRHLSSGQT